MIKNLKRFKDGYLLGDFEIIPYNHFLKDTEWIILIRNKETNSGSVALIESPTLEEACSKAVILEKLAREEEYE